VLQVHVQHHAELLLSVVALWEPGIDEVPCGALPSLSHACPLVFSRSIAFSL